MKSLRLPAENWTYFPTIPWTVRRVAGRVEEKAKIARREPNNLLMYSARGSQLPRTLHYDLNIDAELRGSLPWIFNHLLNKSKPFRIG